MKTYSYTTTEQNFVKSYNNINYNCWNDTSGIITTIRASLRAHYLPIQQLRCCYCKILIQSTNGSLWDVEHILPKSVYPEFLFEPFNLAISCKDCNKSKGNQNILSRNKKYQRYPKSCSSYLIIHPHFDKYSQHMEISILPNTGQIFHIPRSDKGRKTFYICDLVRFSMMTLGANNLEKNLLIAFSKFIDNLDPTSSPEQIKGYFASFLPRNIHSSFIDL